MNNVQRFCLEQECILFGVKQPGGVLFRNTEIVHVFS